MEKSSKKRKSYTPKKVVKPESISFDVYFSSKVRNKILRSEQKREIQVFFEHHGLSFKEPITKFDSILSKY